ncbi:MAG: hypothetical protein RLZZ303_3506 [Candidatus Hydrogenedentota bacterium]|jgi:hypothetical protein
MTHLKPLTRVPDKAQGVTTDVKLAFLADVFDAAVPLFQNKDPQNPLPPDTTGGGTETET